MENRSRLVGSLTYDTYFQGQGVSHRREVTSSKEFSAVTAVPSLRTILSRPVPGLPGFTAPGLGAPKDPPQMGRKGRGGVIEGRGGAGCPFHCCQIHSPVKRMSSDDTDKNPHTCSENVGRIGERRHLKLSANTLEGLTAKN